MGGVKTNLEAETGIKRLFACGEVASVGVHGANRLASNSLLEGLVFGRRAGTFSTKYPGERKNSLRKETPEKQTKANKKINFHEMRKSLQELMDKKAGIIRCGKSLKEALEQLEEWDRVLQMEASLPEECELRNMVTVAQLITASALKREESRGAHYRSDFPLTDDKNWKKHIVTKRFETEDQRQKAKV